MSSNKPSPASFVGRARPEKTGRPSGSGASKRRGIQSIEIGFRIIDVLAQSGQPIPLRTIAERCSMPVANVHNYLVSFLNVGVATQEEDTGFYGLGPYALKLGLAAVHQFDVHKVARPVMADLCRRTNLSVFLGVWGNKGATMVYRVESIKSPPLMELRAGAVLNLLTSALGRNFLAHLPEHMTDSMVRQELKQLKALPPRLNRADIPRSISEVKTLVKRTRENGYSICVGSFLPDYTTMSAPVFDHLGGIIAAITVMGEIDKLDFSPTSDAVLQLKAASQKISSASGWQP